MSEGRNRSCEDGRLARPAERSEALFRSKL